MTPASRPLRIGARSSPLSVAQVRSVAALLAARGHETEFVPITTRGDVDQRDLTAIGGTGVFAAAVRVALLDGSIDLAVHSGKDLPTAPVAGLSIAAQPEREDVRDVLVGRRLDDLTDGDRVGTGSPRRAVQLQSWAAARGLRLEIVSVRGNVGTRLGLVGDRVEAVLLAAAGLRRLGLLTDDPDGRPPVVQGLAADPLPLEVMLPAPAQGALAIEVRSDDAGVADRVTELDHPATAAAVAAERAFLAHLEAGCLAPTAALARVRNDHDPAEDLTLTVVTGRTVVRGTDVDTEGTPPKATPDDDAAVLLGASGRGSSLDPGELGVRLGHQVLTRLLGSHHN